MFVWQRQIVDNAGNILDDATVEVRDAVTNGLVSIFADLEGTTPKSNAFLVDSEGFARFYAPAGLYKITAARSGLERIYEDVLLGIRLADMPDLAAIVEPIVDGILEEVLEELAVALGDLPELVRFSVLDNGGAQGALSDDWSTERIGQGRYRVTHGLSTLNYHPKLTVWDPSNDRVYSAMMVDKQINFFDYQVRSIHNTASASDTRVDIEVTVS